MSPNEVPIPLEKTVVINGSTIEISIAEKKMSDKEKASYKKFMAKCMSESSGKTDREAAMSCAVSFDKMKEKIMAEDEEDDDLEEIKKEEEDEEEEEEDEEKGKTLKEKIELEKKDIKEDKFELELEKKDLKDDKEYLKELKKKKMQESKSAAKKGDKMEYREKPKTSSNSVRILTVEQLRKWELHEKNETREDELKETKEAWRNTVDL
jgi:hypothetical protein